MVYHAVGQRTTLGSQTEQLRARIRSDLYEFLEENSGRGEMFHNRTHGVERALTTIMKIHGMELTVDQALEILEDFRKGDLRRVENARNNEAARDG